MPGARNVLGAWPSPARVNFGMQPGGGGFLILGIPVLSVEHDPLKLFGQAAEFVLALGFLDALQTKVEGLL